MPVRPRLLQSTPAPSRLRADAGVTLIEVMVVIVIIGLITAIVAINVLPSQDAARVTKARADISNLVSALQLYRADTGGYPSMEQGLAALVTPPPATGATAPLRTEGYIARLPNDPWGRPYRFVSPGSENRPFDLYSLGRDGTEGGEGIDADIQHWAQ